MNKVYSIREYGSFLPERTVPGFVTLPQKTFDQLEAFLLRAPENRAADILSLSIQRGLGKVISAKNYVGVLALSDGTVIEILPKIVSAADDSDSARTKELLLKMLRVLPDAPFRQFQTASLDVQKTNLLEIFIQMFLEEVFALVKRGLRCGYTPVEENSQFFHGKLLVSQQLRQNLIHKERSYIVYDAFTADRPENRLLKATLLHLLALSVSFRNRNDLRLLLRAFADIPASTNYPADFSRCTADRNTRDYDPAIRLCQVFLSGKSFTSFSGSADTIALLFPMEVLFERYTAALLRNILPDEEFSLAVQDHRFSLFDFPKNKFPLRPDLVLTRRSDGAAFILDTKWKLLDIRKPNFGISQTDMYQMFAYQKKYSAKSVTLLYPQCADQPALEQCDFRASDGVLVRVRFVDLFTPEKSLQEISRALA